MVCLSLLCETILLLGNIPVKDSEISFKEIVLHPLTTAFKIHLISGRMTSEVVTALYKVICLDFWGNVEEDSVSIFDETLSETFLEWILKSSTSYQEYFYASLH